MKVPTPAEQLARLPEPGTHRSSPLTSGPTSTHAAQTTAARVAGISTVKGKLLDIAGRIESVAAKVPTPNVTDTDLYGKELHELAAELRKINA
jgi:glyceraldehyde-3-phosphate dehydrogenase/erythrose-4-phosphate dehydrogenase